MPPLPAHIAAAPLTLFNVSCEKMSEAHLLTWHIKSWRGGAARPAGLRGWGRESKHMLS